MPDGRRRDVRVRLARSDEGYRFEVRSAVRVDGRDAFELNAQATLALPDLPAPPALDLAAIAARCPGARRPADATAPDARRRRRTCASARAGGCCESIALGDGEGLAELRLPERFAGDLAAGYLLHPALLDLATGWAMELIPGYAPTHLWVPVSYRSVRVHAPAAGRDPQLGARSAPTAAPTDRSPPST